MAPSTPDRDPFAELNPAQRAAATWGNVPPSGGVRAGPALVIAGAGTGKTNTLAHRVAYLLLNGVPPERILLLTFTRRAAAEMTRRAHRIVARVGGRAAGAAAERLWSGTFHATANRLLRIYAGNIGLAPSFSVLDRGDAADLLDVVRHERGLSRQARRFPRKETCLDIYSRRVNAQDDLETVLARHYPWCAEWHDELRDLFRAYVEAKQRADALDYDDLLLYWHGMLQDDELRDDVAARWDHVLVDEYQDTNALQAELLLRLKPDGAGLTVVGDDAQSIYAFRAATVENILGFAERFQPPAAVLKLEQNYRSTQPVLDAANALMAEAAARVPKTLFTDRPGGVPPRYVTVRDDAGQVEYIVETVLAQREGGQRLRDQAVLFRTGHHANLLEVELGRRKIPYVKYGGLKYLEAAHIKDVLAVLRWADNPRNRIVAFRALQLLPGVGPAGAQRAFDALAAADHDFAALAGARPHGAAAADWDALTTLLGALGAPNRPWPGQLQQVRQWYEPHLERMYEAPAVRMADLEQLEAIAGGYDGRERFLSELALDPPAATGDLSGEPMLDEDYLILSTVHSAKGQEWASVYVLNVADGNFPNEFGSGDIAGLEEERRLLYVAMTRAKTDLHLVCPLKYYVKEQHRHGDRHIYGTRSRFMTDAVLATMRAHRHGDATADDGRGPGSDRRLDLGQRIRDMW